ncbi:MAG: O-acetyltransferase WecH [Anaerolineales bacterium]|nr:O-acetyltransferase WecH [Anaerolineales bacterium]
MVSEISSRPTAHYEWADLIRGIGIVLVILGHVSGIPNQRFAEVSLLNWDVSNIYNIIARSCVPLLFMISGALLIPRQESLSDFYRKRFQRVLLPFLFWSVLYVLWKYGCFTFTDSLMAWGGKACLGDYTFINAVKAVAKWILTRPAEYHMWFMYELFALYLITPVLRLLADGTHDRYLWYMVAIWFIFGPLQRLVEFQLHYDLIFDLGFLTSYIGYFILGYLLARIRITKPMAAVAALVYIVMAVYTLHFTHVFSVGQGKLVDYFQYLLSWNIALLAVSLYILLRAWADHIFRVPRPRLAKFAAQLTAASFGIYLIHVFVINWMNSLHISPLTNPAALWIPVTTLAVFFVSWIIIAILMKIPYLRAVVA